MRQCAQLVRQNRSAAIGGLYDLTAQRLVRFAIAITRSQHDAEDALQASLVRVSETPELQAKPTAHHLLQTRPFWCILEAESGQGERSPAAASDFLIGSASDSFDG